MWPNPQETACLVTFTGEMLNGKPHFLWSDAIANLPMILRLMEMRKLKYLYSIKITAELAADYTNTKITAESKRRVGPVIGTSNYRSNYLKEKIAQWTTEIRMLYEIVWYEPQDMYLCFITKLTNQFWVNYSKHQQSAANLKQLDEIVPTEFIPAISGINCPHIERKLLPFPPKLEGIGIPVFSEIAEREYKFSRMSKKI